MNETIIAEVFFGMYRLEGETVWHYGRTHGVVGNHRGRTIRMDTAGLVVEAELETIAANIAAIFGGGE